MTTKKENQTEKSAILLIGSSEQDANMRWVTEGFLQHDPFIFIQTRDDGKILMTSRLEADRAKKQSQVDEIIETLQYAKDRKLEFRYKDIIPAILNDLKITNVVVPTYFPCDISEILKNNGFSVQIKQRPFFEQRAIKTPEEIKNIAYVQQAIENVLDQALDIIRNAKIDGKFLYYHGKILTSEQISKFIKVRLLDQYDIYCPKTGIIVTSGQGTSMPHLLSNGPLRVNSPMTIDIEPKSEETGYFADMTRTFFLGKADSEFKKLYYAVLEAQQMAIDMIAPSTDGFDIDIKARNSFESKGYKTGKINGREQGFIHDLGHGVGLDMHEDPSINPNHGKGIYILEQGNVITIEPGLYYDIGVRIEDLLVVTKNGYENLTKFPKEELMEL